MSVRSSASLRAAAQPRTPRLPAGRGLVLAIVLISQLMVVLDATIVNIALPDIQSALTFSPTGLTWVVTAYTLTFGGLLLLGARAGDILGRKRVFVIGVAVFTIASLVGGMANSAGLLLAARAVQGLGGALAAPSALSTLMTLYPEAGERTKALGWYAAVSVGGSAIGLIAGGLLTQLASWRWVLFVNVPIGLLLVAAALRAMPESERHRGHFDLPGAVTSTLGMTSLVYGLVRAADSGWGDALTLLALGAAVVLLAGFIVIERRAEAPVVPLGLFADRNRASSLLGRLLLVAGILGMFFFLTQFLQDIWGYSPTATGVAFLPLTVMLFVMSQLSARVVTRRLGARTTVLIGLTFSAVALFLLSRITPDSGYLSVLVPLVMFGSGNGLAFVPLTSLALDGAPQHQAGAASGLVNAFHQVGGALGLAVLATVFAHAAGPAVSGTGPAADAAFVTGVQHAFVWASGFLVATVLLLAIVARRPASELAAGSAGRDKTVRAGNRNSMRHNESRDDDDAELALAKAAEAG